MTIQYLDVKTFRNLSQVQFEPDPSLNVIVGKNGSGKTSLLEAIYFLSVGKSFRTPHSHHLIQFSASQFNLFGKVVRGDTQIPIGLEKSPGKTRIKIANDNVTSASELAMILPVQIINPDSHKLIEEGPRFRRRFMEWGMFHVKPGYLKLWQDCRQILKQRNAALKSGWKKQDMHQWDVALESSANSISQARRQYLQDLQAQVQKIAEQLKEPLLQTLQLKFRQGWPKDKTLQECLKESWATEQKKGFTQYGPHKSDFDVLVEGTPAKQVVSRGQQKLITAILKIAQVHHLAPNSETKPVLLVDDLAAELDADFRKLLMSFLSTQQIQVFVTAVQLDIASELQESYPGKLFHVEHGCLTERTAELVTKKPARIY